MSIATQPASASSPTVDGILELATENWNSTFSSREQEALALGLEKGSVLYLPNLSFNLTESETRFLNTKWSNGKSKSIYLRGPSRAIAGASGATEDLEELRAMIERFSTSAISFLTRLFPKYAKEMVGANTSFRPHAVETRISSYRKDDRLLHADAFPSNPTHGTRILRFFTNVHPGGAPREWRIGEPFADMARKFLPKVPKYSPLLARGMELIRVTKSYRTEYDHMMLHLHDLVKGDSRYQSSSPQRRFDFPPGSSWIVFSDQVLHAAMAGQYMMEQTVHLPVDAQYHPELSPLKTLETMAGRQLV